jgi:hypothetical protein
VVTHRDAHSVISQSKPGVDQEDLYFHLANPSTCETNTAYSKPYRVSAVVPHEHSAPHVLFMNWGEWDDWPLGHAPSAAE